MNKCRTSLELFFAIWFVMGNVWVFDSRFGSFQRAPKLHMLCISACLERCQLLFPIPAISPAMLLCATHEHLPRIQHECGFGRERSI